MADRARSAGEELLQCGRRLGGNRQAAAAVAKENRSFDDPEPPGPNKGNELVVRSAIDHAVDFGRRMSTALVAQPPPPEAMSIGGKDVR